jgi:hypothetical protein
MTMGFNVTVRTACMTAKINALDANASPGYIEFYSGTRPATGAAIGAAVQLGTCTLSKPSASVASAVATFNAVTNGTGTAGAGVGTAATWCRFKDGAGTFVTDGSVSATGGGGDIQMNSVIVATGQTISVNTSGTLTEGNA